MATVDEIRIAQEIMKAVRRLQLPLKLDEITEGRGNCFPLSVLAQCRREEIFPDLTSPIKSLAQQGDPTLLRRAIWTFITNSSHQKIQEFKRRYHEILAALDSKTWREYWNVMLRNYEWVDSIFIQSAAWFLGHDIIIVTTTCTEDHPYITISGNLIDENIPCPCIPSKSNVHFQSLLPLQVRGPRNPIEARLPQDTIYMKVSAIRSKESNEYARPNLDSREDFPELRPSVKIQMRTLNRRKDMQRASRHTHPIDNKINKEEQVLSPDPKNKNLVNLEKHNETKVFQYASSEKNEDPGLYLISRDEFPELKPSIVKRQVQLRNSNRKKKWKNLS